MNDTITKPKIVDYFQVPDDLWQLIQHHYAKPASVANVVGHQPRLEQP
jgi:hypothetical protein